MARRKGFLQSIAQAQREAERQRKAYVRQQTQLATQAAKAREAYQRAQLAAQQTQARQATQDQKAYERARAEAEKERARLYTESRAAEVALMNEQLADQASALERILADTLGVDDYLDLDTRKQTSQIPPFNPGALGSAERQPSLDEFMPPPLSSLRQLMPGAKAKHAEAVAQAHAQHASAITTHAYREQQRLVQLNAARAAYDQQVLEIEAQTAAQHAEINQLKQDLASGVPTAVTAYCAMVLEVSSYPEGFPQHAKLAYVPESKQLVVEYDLPPFDAVPAVAAYKYTKAKDEIGETARPAAQRRALYASAVAQVTLRTLHELFEADRINRLETIIFNGYVDTIDRATGRSTRICLVTVRTTRDTFSQLDLSRVDPAACLKALNASVSKSPAELAPVRPVLEFSMVDPRFIEETDVLSTLDQRPNLMELTPSEFEALIANLFKAMGLETRLTQASRDGGVDCVAYDPRPILGGKVVIQAKRYKHTVGVSAVRDLYGTMQNEGASKGILVTTSGYGKAAFDFAEGKPLELLSGSNLLYLLKEHAGMEAKIEVPEGWRDPQMDVA